jgi:hypothetical protein
MNLSSFLEILMKQRVLYTSVKAMTGDRLDSLGSISSRGKGINVGQSVEVTWPPTHGAPVGLSPRVKLTGA